MVVVVVVINACHYLGFAFIYESNVRVCVAARRVFKFHFRCNVHQKFGNILDLNT